MALGCLYLVAAAGLAAPAASPAPSAVLLGVDWPSFLARHDPVWDWSAASGAEAPPDKFCDALFGGNAMVGFMLWQPTNRTVRVDIGRSDVYDDRSAQSTPTAWTNDFVYDQPRLPIGHYLLTFDAPVLGAVGRLSLWDAEASYNVSAADGKTCELRAFAPSPTAESTADVVVLEATRGGACGRVEFVPALADSLWAPRTAHVNTSCSSQVAKGLKKCWCHGEIPETAHASGYGLCMACVGGCPWNASMCSPCNNYEYNPKPVLTSRTGLNGRVNLTTQMHLRGTAHTTAIYTCGGAEEDCGRGGLAYFTAVSSVSKDWKTADGWAAGQVSAAAQLGIVGMRASHRKWWSEWWPRGGFVTYEYTVLESLYFIMQYKFGSAARRGRAFMDLNGPWMPLIFRDEFLDRNTNAPDVHWDWNIQGMYYMPFLTNRPEIAASLVDYSERSSSILLYFAPPLLHFALISLRFSVEGLLDTGVLWSPTNVQSGWEDGAAAPTGASGLSGKQSCYWNVGPINCTVGPPSVTGNLLWTLQVVQQSGVYAGNSTVATGVVWPLLVRAVRFYQHFWIENATAVSLPPTFSPEYGHAAAPNANYDLALLRWGLKTALQLNTQFKFHHEDEAMWQRVAAKLVGPSLDSEGRLAIYEGVPLAQAHRHFSHMLTMWPLRDLPQLTPEKSAASLDLWSSMKELDSLFGSGTAASMNADLGRHADALDNMTFFARTRVVGSGWYGEGAGFTTVCNEATYMAAYALADWLLQSHNTSTLAGPGLNGAPVKILELFRGTPDEVPLDGAAYDAAPASIATGSFYRLAAEGGFVVSAARERVASAGSEVSVVYKARTSFVAVESTIGGPCVLRIPADFRGTLRAHPPTVSLKELGDGTVQLGIGKGESVAVWAGSATPPPFVVAAKDGCSSQRNFWGGSVVAEPESRLPVPVPSADVKNKTVLKPCVFDGGMLTQSQRWRFSGGVFELQDGSGRCLAVDDCNGASGAAAVLRSCLHLQNEADAAVVALPIGCQAPWTDADSWPRGHGNGPQPPQPHGACTSAASQRWSFTPSASVSWSDGIQSNASGACLEIYGGQDPSHIALDGCETRSCNVVWRYNSSSGAIESLTKAPCVNASGWCLTDAGAVADEP